MTKRSRKMKHDKSEKKLSLATKISLSALAVMVIGGAGTAYYAVDKYGDTITNAIDEGYQKSKSINEVDFNQNRPTNILDKNGNVLKELKTQERDYISYKDMDPLVGKALVSIEDRRFFEHKGVDTQGLLTVAGRAITGGGVRGASTITQQLVKNIYLTPEVSIGRKIEEMVIAQELEKKFSKEQILEFYLNNVYFGHGAYGINAASHVYFDKPINDTSLLEKAVLVSVTNNPTQFDPVENKENVTKRAHLVLKSMEELGYISKSDYETAMKDDFNVKENPNVINNDLDNNEVALAVDSATKILMEEDGFRFHYRFGSKEEEDEYNQRYNEAYNKVYHRILSGGYEIQTSIDMDLHQRLQEIVTNTMEPWQDRDPETNLYTKQAAMTVIDNATGLVVASVGGRGEEGNTYNRAFLSNRQPGSAIKPLVAYAPAFDRGLLENSQISDDRLTDLYPNNIYNGSKGNLTLRRALTISSNVVAYKLAEDNRTESKEPVYAPLARMKFSGLDVADDNPIIAVGGMTYGATTQEMASGIATLANQGVFRTPTNVTKIIRKDNQEEVYSVSNNKQKRVYSDDAAYLTIDAMKQVHESEEGTAHDTTLAHNQYWAVKTGTTDEAKDLWTVGATPHYTAAVWLGDDTPQPQDNLTMGKKTREIFKATMDIVNEGKEDIDFAVPSSVERQGDQWVTRSSQKQQMLTVREQQLANDLTAIDTQAQTVAGNVQADLLNAPEYSEGMTFAKDVISSRLTELQHFSIYATDKTDNWGTFTHYAEEVHGLISELEPQGGDFTNLYQSIYDKKAEEYAQQQQLVGQAERDVNEEIKAKQSAAKELDKEIKDLETELEKEK